MNETRQAAGRLMEHKGHLVVEDPDFGYLRLEPIPNDSELADFYQSHYYDLLRKGNRAPELHRLTGGGEEAERERAWLRATLYEDVEHVLREHAGGRRVLDVGCGTGELLAYLAERGFETVGTEPSTSAAEIAKGRGLEVHSLPLEEFARRQSETRAAGFDAITLLNVLEHVPDPRRVIECSKALLAPGGILCVRVPNDFSEIQLAAQACMERDPWWVAVPDHINYFNFESLRSFLERLGFDVVYSQADFPMEMFLMMGDDYASDSATGRRCHEKRKSFEMSMPAELRRRTYRALAGVGVGRNCLVFGRLKAQ